MMSIEIPAQIIWGMVGYILITTMGFVAWAATTTQQLKTLEKMVNDLSNLNSYFAKKEDVARELGILERNQETMWGKLDKLKEKVDSERK